MSRNEWERGEIKMSVKEFGAVRRDLIAFHNQRQTSLFERAKSVYSILKTAGKGKRNFEFQPAFEAAIVAVSGYAIDDGYNEIYSAIFPHEQVEKLVAGQFIKGWERSEKPKAPKKNQFAPLKQNAERIDVGHEAGIGFDKKRRVIIWSVSENNHSVDRAHEHATGREFFKRLSRVVWTHGTGGEIVGNDEYNQDSRESGGGSNYVTSRFGVAEQKVRAAQRLVNSTGRSWR